MRERTVEILKKYEVAWQKSLHPHALSFARVGMIFSDMPASFSELVELTGLSSSTLNIILKNGIKRGFISKQRQESFPWKSTYSLTKDAEILRVAGHYIKAMDNWARVLIEGASEKYKSAEEIVEKTNKLRNGWLDTFFRINHTWLEGGSFKYIQYLFSALNSVTFWGTFFILRFPHIQKKAKKMILQKGEFPSSETELLKKILLPNS